MGKGKGGRGSHDSSNNNLEEEQRIPNVQREGDLFELMVEAATDGKIAIQALMDLCYEYGVADGKTVESQITGLTKRSTSGSVTIEDELLEAEIRKVVSSREESLEGNNSTTNESTSSLSPSRNGAKRIVKSREDLTSVTNQPNRISLNSLQGVFMLIPPEPDPNVRTLKSRRIEATTQAILLPYQAVLHIFDRTIELGYFPTEQEAAIAHDRAYLRVIGPKHCPPNHLNFPLTHYANDSLSEFDQYDSLLRSGLFGSDDFTGLKECDFSFLLTQSNITIPFSTPSSSSSSSSLLNTLTKTRKK